MKQGDKGFSYHQFKTIEGDTITLFDNKPHNWEGPAIVRADGSEEYYLYGKQLSLYEWKEVQRDRIGLPPAKNPMFKAAFQ